MDPLSDVLALLKPRSYRCGGFEAGGAWSIRFGRHEGIKCYALGTGECWLAMDDVDEPVRLRAGDCFLLASGRGFRLASDLSLPPADALPIFAGGRGGAIAVHNGGGDFSFVGGHFLLSGGHADGLLSLLPPIVHLRSDAERASLRWCLERLMVELREQRPGGVLVAQQLAYTMLVQALRLHVTDGGTKGVGWLFALSDKQMGAAIGAMHDEPARRWTVAELAGRAGMSRSVFAEKFKTTVGESPMEYLTRWRMLLAGDRLANSGDGIAVIAQSLGYESESAFSTAFKRVMGCPPRQYKSPSP